jgi:opacity protein-like surface antigen
MNRETKIAMKGLTEKKCILICIFSLISTFCFAQNKWNLEFYGGVPLFNETSDLNGPEVNQKSTSLSLGISGGYNFTDFIGIKAYVDYFFPIVFTSQPSGSGATINRGQYDMLFGIDELVGVVFNVFRTDRFIVPVSVGFHGKLLVADIYDYVNLVINSGIGLAIGAEFKITDKMYLFGRVRGSFDFLGFAIAIPSGSASNQETNMDVAIINTWGLSPNIGIGFRF